MSMVIRQKSAFIYQTPRRLSARDDRRRGRHGWPGNSPVAPALLARPGLAPADLWWGDRREAPAGAAVVMQAGRVNKHPDDDGAPGAGLPYQVILESPHGTATLYLNEDGTRGAVVGWEKSAPRHPLLYPFGLPDLE